MAIYPVLLFFYLPVTEDLLKTVSYWCYIFLERDSVSEAFLISFPVRLTPIALTVSMAVFSKSQW